MNIIAIDIGNANIRIGFFLGDIQRLIEIIPGQDTDKITDTLKTIWHSTPLVKGSKEKKRDAVVVVSSVKPAWTKAVAEIVFKALGEKIKLIGTDIPLPIELKVKKTEKIGTDRVLAAAAAAAIAQGPVVVADFGTAVTIDLVDENKVFLGGVIFPGFEISADALKTHTAKLPKVKIKKPKTPFGKTTTDAINCGLYYSAIGALEEIIRRYAETLGQWPQTVLTGGAAELIKDDCTFIDSFAPDLVVNGIVLAYKKHIGEKAE